MIIIFNIKMKEFAEFVIQFVKLCYIRVITKLFPARTISTFFGIGYLPEWQAHWASLLSVSITVLIIYVFTNFEGSIVDLSIVAVIISIIVFFIGLISIHILHLRDPSVDDEIMIHIVFGQIFVLGFSAPAVVTIGGNIVDFNDFICEKFLACAPWFYKIVTYVPILLIPYVVYRFVDNFKPWPASLLDRDYNTVVSNMCEGLINALYTLLVLYLSAFIFFGLTMDQALLFFHDLIHRLLEIFNIFSVIVRVDEHDPNLQIYKKQELI